MMTPKLCELRKGVLQELKMQDSLIQKWGVDLAKETSPNSATVKYNNFLLAAAVGKVEGGKGLTVIATSFEKTKLAAYTVGAMTPYLRLSAFLVRELRMLLDHDESNYFYKKWIDKYSSEGFEALARQFKDLLDKLSISLTGEELEVIERLYHQAMKLQIDFFSAQPVVQRTVVPLSRVHDPAEHRLVIFSDFDLTCNVVDSSAILAEIAIVTAAKADKSGHENLATRKLSVDLRNSWDALSGEYIEEYEQCIDSILPSEEVKAFNYEELCKALEELSDFENARIQNFSSQDYLRAKGIFRINAENSQEEFVKDQLNTGIVPDGIDVHCLAGLIKAWFRELPSGVLDSLTPEQVMQCQTEEECAELVRVLPQTESALLDWAINLMADVVQEEHHNKMNARNVAMVFAPNMTQMADPLTALMYAVQVMNFLKTLIIKTLKERQDSVLVATSISHSDPSDENGHRGPSQPPLKAILKEDPNPLSVSDETILNGLSYLPDDDCIQTSCEKAISDGNEFSTDDFPCETAAQTDILSNGLETTDDGSKTGMQANPRRSKTGQSSNSSLRKGVRKGSGQPPTARLTQPSEKTRGISIVSRINSRVERIEAWR